MLSLTSVLITKLRSANTVETQQYRKATKALVVLIPLLGITYILVIWAPTEGPYVNLYAHLRAILLSTQGFTVAFFLLFPQHGSTEHAAASSGAVEGGEKFGGSNRVLATIRHKEIEKGRGKRLAKPNSCIIKTVNGDTEDKEEREEEEEKKEYDQKEEEDQEEEGKEEEGEEEEEEKEYDQKEEEDQEEEGKEEEEEGEEEEEERRRRRRRGV
ncbi:hypothetical protein WDU94_005091 [Cyamophila willieti]